MKIGETEIQETFAEAFSMHFVSLIITAADEYWLNAALNEVTGYSASVISCDAETGISTRLDPVDTPDGRIGASNWRRRDRHGESGRGHGQAGKPSCGSLRGSDFVSERR